MEINLMTWNTQLYEYGNLNGKKTDDAPVKEITTVVQNFMASYENPIVVLQEIPFKVCVGEDKWEYNPNWGKVKKEVFDKFEWFLWENNEEKLELETGIILVTAVIAKKGLLSLGGIKREVGEEYRNRFVPVVIKEKDVSILGVHAPLKEPVALNKWIESKKGYAPNIIIGDCNAGNYIKDTENEELKKNRANFQSLSTGYIDACQGKYTTCYTTQIDHILIENSFRFNKRYKLIDVIVYKVIACSDHYPIHCKMIID